MFYPVIVGAGLLVFIGLLSARSNNRTGHRSIGDSSSGMTPVKAVYLVQENSTLPLDELSAYPEVVVVKSFIELQQQAQDKTALWIDKNAVRVVDSQWLNSEPQMYYPLVLVGYNDTLYSFREVLPLELFYGPIIDWSMKKVEPGFSVILRDKSFGQVNRPTAVFLKGYNQKPHVKDIIDITNSLLEGELRITPTPPSSISNKETSPTPP